MDNIEKDTRMKSIENMMTLLESIREKKKALFPDAESYFFDKIKATNYKTFIEWLNSFSKKLNIDVYVKIRTEPPTAMVHFYKKEIEENGKKKDKDDDEKRNMKILLRSLLVHLIG